MAIASLANIEKTFGDRVIFDKLEFSIDRGERVGLIGDNGSGKSTLFRVLAGQMPIDLGTVAISKNVKLGYLQQDPTFDMTNTVIDEAELAFAELHALSHRMRDLEHEMAHLAGDELEKILNKYQDVQHQFDLAGGYAWQHRLEATLLGVGLGRETWEQNVGTLSGGQRSRLALAKLLIAQSELLLLDEPTNHLDLTAVAWLEDYLLSFNGAVLIISHDRYLLDRLATRIVWLTQSRLKSYPGNYSAFVEQRQLQELTQQRAYEQQQKDIDKQSEFIRRFGAGQRSKEAKGREKRLDRLLASEDLIQSVGINHKIRVSLNTDQRAGDRVLSVKELQKAYDTKVLWNDVSLEMKRGDRMGILGPNGSGKTTMLEVLLGRTDADGGEIRWGANLNIGYYDQRLGDFNPDNTIADEVRDGRDVSPQDLRAVLALMLFNSTDIEKPIRLLSGGERARVAMAQLLIDKPNVLVLDEPTNHLDINSCEALERALRDFQGTIICVSHDRYFLDKTVNRLLILEPPGVLQFTGNYTEWASYQIAQAKKEAEAKKPQKQKKAPPPPPVVQKKQKADNAWARPFGRLTVQELEQQISATEIEIGEFQNQFSNAGVTKDADRNRRMNDQYKELNRKLKQLEEEYYARNT
ncbi:MAG: ATP-binding cassette domain-containing protein [Planctomycetota bacterium]|nr:ATP-binding cassette domain-containing protein [Planctomycetota bacterium]